MRRTLTSLISVIVAISATAQSLMFEQTGLDWPPGLKDFKEAAESGNIENLYDSMSSGFRRGISFAFFKNELKDHEIQDLELIPLNSTQFDEAGYGVFKIQYQLDEIRVSSIEVIFFRKEGDSWMLENFPMTSVFPMNFAGKGLKLRDGIYDE